MYKLNSVDFITKLKKGNIMKLSVNRTFTKKNVHINNMKE